MKKEYFYANMKCANCNFGVYGGGCMEVPKGTPSKHFSKSTECPDCGCKNTLYYYGWSDVERCDYPFPSKAK